MLALHEYPRGSVTRQSQVGTPSVLVSHQNCPYSVSSMKLYKILQQARGSLPRSALAGPGILVSELVMRRNNVMTASRLVTV